MLKETLFTIPQYLLPQHWLTGIAGRLAHCKTPWLKNKLIQRFMQHYSISLNEAMIEDPTAFATFNDFFTRQLKPAARPIDNHEDCIISPVDGQVCQIGSISNDQLFQAKQFRFNLVNLLGGNNDKAKPFLFGEFACFYLAPNAYHRVHMPFTGTLKEMTYIPGSLFSVNRATTNSVPNLFARNERVVCLFDTAIGPMAVILVGAMLVGSVNTQWHGNVMPPRLKRMQTWEYSAPSMTLKKGDELGYFNMGSTVLILLPNNKMQWDSQICLHNPVQMGQRIGVIHGT